VGEEERKRRKGGVFITSSSGKTSRTLMKETFFAEI
jgi:hypothetical protein